MRLCMFHPLDRPLERGWAGRVEGDHVVHLAAQTLQHFFTGGSSSREHDVYALDAVSFVVPVLHPPAVRVFDGDGSFRFANPAALGGPGATVRLPGGGPAELHVRRAAVIGVGGTIGGFGSFVEVRAPQLPEPKDRDFGSLFGPFVLTPDEADDDSELELVVDGSAHLLGDPVPFDWEGARAYAASGTVLRAGDLLAGPSASPVEGRASSRYELSGGPFGSLSFSLA